MNTIMSYLNDMIIIAFDLLLYAIMCPSRRDTWIPKIFKHIGCALILVSYFYAVYILGFPAAVSSTFCMGIPSFLLFLYYTKYRDSRFILTFCFVDSITLIVAFLCRIIIIYLKYGEIISVTLSLFSCIGLLCLALHYAKRYQTLLEEVKAGWGIMAFSSVCIYFALIFIAGYPKPMIERQEYIPVWLTLAVVVLSSYMVFIHSILKTKRISLQNIQLQHENELYHLAFHDGLTSLYNRSSYIEKIHELERTRKLYHSFVFLVADINEFKKVNDTLGHHEGDRVLTMVAMSLTSVFVANKEYIFRMGGDEFLVILPDKSESEILQLIDTFNTLLKVQQAGSEYKITMSVGYSILIADDDCSLESAYIKADKQMYLKKQAFYEDTHQNRIRTIN